MNSMLVKIYKILTMFGLDLVKMIRSIRGVPYYCRNLILLKKQERLSEKKIPFAFVYPCLDDRFSESGKAKGHYFYQDLLVARKVYHNKPVKHVDIGSRVDGFVAHIAAFREIEVFDIRPLSSSINGIQFKQVDLMRDDLEVSEYCDSLSSLHAVEHFGLGRYGDSVCYDGYLSGLESMNKILQKGGKFYFSTPIGPQRIEFDAHRVFSIEYLLELFRDKYMIDSFSYVDDRGDFYEDVKIDKENLKNNFGCVYGCGIFEMTKL